MDENTGDLYSKISNISDERFDNASIEDMESHSEFDKREHKNLDQTINNLSIDPTDLFDDNTLPNELSVSTRNDSDENGERENQTGLAYEQSDVERNVDDDAALLILHSHQATSDATEKETMESCVSVDDTEISKDHSYRSIVDDSSETRDMQPVSCAMLVEINGQISSGRENILGNETVGVNTEQMRDVALIQDEVLPGEHTSTGINIDKEHSRFSQECVTTHGVRLIANTDDSMAQLNDQNSVDPNGRLDMVENETNNAVDNSSKDTSAGAESLDDTLIKQSVESPIDSSNGSSSPRKITPSLADDAKAVKFNVSAKSMNIIQSNTQFLNKSRNFLSFITEKSTNIMEKTLLPQNLTATYNNILRRTDNNPGNNRKSIEETSVSTKLTQSMPASRSNNEENVLGTTDDFATIPDTVRFSITDDLAQIDDCLDFKPSVEENHIDSQVPNTTPTTESKLLAETFSDINLGNGDTNLPYETVDQIHSTTLTSLRVECSLDKQIELESIVENDSQLPIAMVAQNFVSESNHVEESTKNFDQTESDVPSENNDDATIILPHSSAIITKNDNAIPTHDEPSVTNDLKNETSGSLDHSVYLALLRDYTHLKDENAKLTETVKNLDRQKKELAAENSRDAHASQLQMLQQTIEKLKSHQKQMSENHETLNREYILANKERESMVMKYAISEKQLIDTQRAREYAERKLKDSLKEQELLQSKLKQVQSERTRLGNILDSKCHELTDAQKEVEKLRDESNMRDVKLKWAQNKLKTEADAQKDIQQKLDKAMVRINEMKEECELVRKESEETIRKFQLSEENKAVSLDQQLKEQQARLILERHVTEDKELSRIQLQKEVDVLKQRQLALIEENNTLSLKVQNLEKERLNYENNLSHLKILADQRQKEIVDLVGKVSQLETIKLQLNHKEQLLASNEAEVERLRESNTELQADMEWCREREAHMLDFTQKLTDKNVRLQSEFTTVEARAQQLEQEQGPLRDKIKELSAKIKQLETSLASEKNKRTEECELLARHVAEQTQLARNLTQQLEDSKSENAVLRRKQHISVKEMTKELQQCRKRLEAFETASPANSLDPISRTASTSSLNTGDTPNIGVLVNNGSEHVMRTVEPDRQALIDRIVKLQKIRVKQAEKLDFLEEHSATLVNELQKKTKIIKNYILHENSDAMGSNERDKNKVELARHGGIMASVYNQRVSDDNMTLELSLEINQKLQAVLEDTLLKNITLKDSIDTLGGEIARLTMQNKPRK